MQGVRRPAARLLAGAVVATLAQPASVAVAVDEPAPVTLPGDTVIARPADLDGDGVREVVRIVAGAGRGPLEVEVWRQEGTGWRESNRAPILNHKATGDDPAPATNDVATLLPWRDGAAERMLVLSGWAATPFDAVDRLRIQAISLDGTRLGLVALPGGEGPARRVESADLDADGVEELVVTEGGSRMDASGAIRVLRWSGERFSAERISAGDGRYPTEPVIGDSDGRGGADVVIGLHDGRDLYRVTGSGRGLEVERTSLDLDGLPPLSWPIVVARGGIYLFGDLPRGPHVARVEWPRGGDPVVTAVISEQTVGWLQPVEGEHTLSFIDDVGSGRLGGGGPDAVVRDAQLEVIATLPTSPAAERAEGWIASGEGLVTGFGGPFPYRGPFPGGVDGSAAYVRSGNLIVFDDDGIDVRPTATFIGMAPLGLAGIDDGWLLVTRGLWTDGRYAYLHGFAPVADGTWLVPADEALRPEENGGELEVRLRGAAVVDDGVSSWVASADGGFEVVVRGAPGSRAGAVIAGRLVAQAELDAEGSAVLELDPRPRRNDTVEYAATVVLLTPLGQAYSTDWRGVVLRAPPTLEASAQTRDGALEARVAGRTDPYVTLSIDGRPVAVDPQGGFGATVDAGIVPRDIVILATDPVGREATQRLEVVGLVDYRGWPWLPIAGVSTALAGLGMYLVGPRRRPITATRDDGTIEEMEA